MKHQKARDPDYERMQCQSEWVIQYWWPDRCYRWVRQSRFRFGVMVRREPPPEDQPVQRGGYREAAAKALSAKRRAAGQKTEDRLHTLMLDEGPMTARQLAEKAQATVMTVRKALERRPDLFHKTGEYVIVQGPKAPIWEAIAREPALR